MNKKITLETFYEDEGLQVHDLLREGRARELHPIKVAGLLSVMVAQINALTAVTEKMAETMQKMTETMQKTSNLRNTGTRKTKKRG